MATLTRFTGIIVGLAGLLSGCCVAERCDCRDQYADTFFLRFSRDTATAAGRGFRAAETRDFYLIRTPLDSLDRPLSEEVELSAPVGTSATYDFTISATGPFAQNPRKASQYAYRVVNAARRPFEVKITDIHLSGQYTTVDACCTCYENLKKSLRINGGTVLDVYTAPGAAPIIVELTKP